MSAEVVPVSSVAHEEFEPLYDRILVQRDQEKETIGTGALVAADQYKEKPLKGTVIAVGAGRLLDNGTLVPLKLHVGDRIVFGLFAGLRLPEEFGKDLLVLSEAEVIARLHEE